MARSIIHYLGVSHRAFGFPTLSNERHESVETVHAAIEPNRTNKKYSNWKKSNALYSNEFDWVRSLNEVELFTKNHEWNKIVQLIQCWDSQGDLKFWFPSLLLNLFNGSVLSGHSVLSGQSRFFAHTNTVFATCIMCGHPVAVLRFSFVVIFTCI